MRAVSMRPSGPEARGLCALRRRQVIARLLLACAVLLGAERAVADIPAPTPEPAKDVVALRDIPDQLLQDREKLDQIEHHTATNEKLEALHEPVAQIVTEIEANRVEDLARIEEARGSRTIELIASAWVRRRAQINALERELSSAGSVLARELGELVALRARWEGIRKELHSATGSDVLLKGVGDTLSKIDATRALVEHSLQPIVQMAEQLSTAGDHADQVEQAIADARRQIRNQLFRIESPPLWEASIGVEGGYRAALREKLQISIQGLLEYGRANSVPLTLFGLFGAAFAIALVFLNRSVAGWAEQDPLFAGAAKILARPIAGSALIVLMAGLLVAFRDAPDLTKATAGLLLLWPMSRLLDLGILPGLRTSVFAIGGWYLFEMARAVLLIDGSLASRLALLAESAGAVGLVYWLRRPSHLVHLGDAGLLLRAVGVALSFAIPVLLVAIVANAIGNVSLAELINRGILLSLYLTYFVHAALGVLEAAYGTLLRTRGAQHSRIVRYHRPLLMERGKRALQVAATLSWLVVTARVFQIDDLAYEAIAGALKASVRVGQIEVSLGDFVLFGLLTWGAFVFSRIVRFVLEEDVLSRIGLPRGVPFAVSTIARYTILVIGFLMAAAAAGLDLGRFTLVAGALGVGIGIGLQNVVNNFVSGLILLFERPIQLGDAVEVGPIMGTVRRIGMRSSTVRTYDGAEVVIPNSQFVSTQFTNWTLSDRNRRIRLPIGVAYGSDPERVIQLLLGAAKGIERIRAHPEPEAFFLGFGESALNFELRVWASNFDDGTAIQSELSVAVNAALREAGIEVPFPQRDLHVRSVSPELRGEGS